MNWSCPRLIQLFTAGSAAAQNCSNLAGDVDNNQRSIGMNVDSATGAFNITNYTGQTYFPAGRTGVANSIASPGGAPTGGTCSSAPRGDQGTGLPGGATTLQQNNGAEIMIWANNRGYAPDNVLDATHLITPAGDKVESLITIPGAPGTWDVWINRQAMDRRHRGTS